MARIGPAPRARSLKRSQPRISRITRMQLKRGILNHETHEMSEAASTSSAGSTTSPRASWRNAGPPRHPGGYNSWLALFCDGLVSCVSGFTILHLELHPCPSVVKDPFDTKSAPIPAGWRR